MEEIKHAAIIRSDEILVLAKSHPEIIKKSPYGTCKADSKQGFLTSEGRFVDRREALQIALKAGQVNKDMKTIRHNELISENIWADTDHKYDIKKGYYKENSLKNNNREKISKRKLESYKRAEKVCQEFRYQAVLASREDWSSVLEYLSKWMKVTSEKIKFTRPDGTKDE